jgi:hypothetical protein
VPGISYNEGAFRYQIPVVFIIAATHMWDPYPRKCSLTYGSLETQKMRIPCGETGCHLSSSFIIALI